MLSFEVHGVGVLTSPTPFQAPFLLYPQECRLAKPIEQDHVPLVALMSIAELGEMVIEYLTHEDLKKLALASSATHEIVSSLVV